MKYNPHLSNILDVDIFVMNSGAVYYQFNSNMYHLGTTSSSISELRSQLDNYM